MIKEKLESLTSQLNEVLSKRKELSEELDKLTTIAVKLQGGIEVLQGVEEESDKKEEK